MKVKQALKKLNLSKLSVIFYWLLVIALLGLFFTNDFGLVDIHKTAIISAIGIDSEEGEVLVTCEVAVPQPSQSGDNIKYTQIQGSGLTIADAMNEVNSKTGFYPKLQFCRLVLIGDSCKDEQLFRMLGCLYRKNYSELTALVAMCKGKASEMLSYKSPVSDMTSEAIRKCISEEIEKSANAVTVNLKDIGAAQYSMSKACYMPYVEANIPGTSENGGNGENVGGDPAQGGGQQGGGQSGGEQGGEGGEGGRSGASAQSQQGGEEMEFTARKTAVFSNGIFKGILDERQSFALAVLKDEIRLAVLPCDAEGIHYTIGLKNVSGGVKLKIEGEVPVVTVSFKAKAQIQGARIMVKPDETVKDDAVLQPVLDGAVKEMEKRFSDLVQTVKQTDCDVLGVNELLYKYHVSRFDEFKDGLLEKMEVRLNVNIESVN